ncbi:MAG TPA: outer membrane beta-barrel protein [Anaeromyxobacter sp.]
MKNLVRLTLALCALALASPASAQQQGNPVRVGLGVGLPTGGELTTLFAQTQAGSNAGIIPPQIYVPIDFTPSFRLEPEIGFVTSSQDGGDSAAYYTFGAGAFYMMQLAQQAHLYVGGRLLVGLERSTTNGGGGFQTKTKGTDLFVGAALGGEILPHPRIGVGAEAQLGRWGIGDRDETTAGVTTTTPGGSAWQTNGIIFVRLYFN